MCYGVPLPPYIKEEREEAGQGVRHGGPFFRRWKREGEGEGEGKKGRTPFPLSNSDSPWGACATPCGIPSLSRMAHVGPLLSPGGFGNPSVLR